jgi:uncharacterized protein YegJ (DUF2314 family)
MNRISQITLAAFTLLLTPLTARSKRDQVINAGDGDPEMLAAMAKVQDTLPQFGTVLDKRVRGDSGFSLKVRITDTRARQHLRATDIERREGMILGLA